MKFIFRDSCELRPGTIRGGQDPVVCLVSFFQEALRARMDTKEIIKEYFGSKSELEDFLSKINLLIINRDRRQHLNLLNIGFKKIKEGFAKAIRHNDFFFEPSIVGKIKEVIKVLEKYFSFEPFPRKQSHGLPGRPHKDPENYFTAMISKTIVYRGGSYKGDTNWEQFFAIVDYYKKRFPFLENISRDPGNLKNLRNKFLLQNPNLEIPQWDSIKRRNEITKLLKKNNS